MPIVVFNATSQALMAEKALEDKGIAINIVPLPKEFAADCGLAIEFEDSDRQVVEAVLGRRRLEYKGIYR